MCAFTKLEIIPNFPNLKILKEIQNIKIYIYILVFIILVYLILIFIAIMQHNQVALDMCSINFHP